LAGPRLNWKILVIWKAVVHRMHTVSQHVFISGIDRKTMNWKERKEKENKEKFRTISVSGGRDSLVGIATRYELDGPRIESHWRGGGGRDPGAHPASRTMGAGFPSRGYSGRAVALTTHSI